MRSAAEEAALCKCWACTFSSKEVHHTKHWLHDQWCCTFGWPSGISVALWTKWLAKHCNCCYCYFSAQEILCHT